MGHSRLSDYDGLRENNFTLVRIVFAYLVLFGHSWPIVAGHGLDPISRLFDGYIWIGALAVNGFFAISGFLVAGSFARQGLVGYAVARILRIFPGLVVCIALSVFVLGLSQTTLHVWDYLRAPETHKYLLNATLVPNLQWLLPGVFTDHPLKAVNGSLWTLKVEVLCYIVLAMIGAAGLLRYRWYATSVLALFLVVGYAAFEIIPFFGSHPKWDRPAAYFILGVLAWVWRGSIRLHPIGAIIAATTIAAIIWLDAPNQAFNPIFALCFIYLIFFATFVAPHVNADKFPGDLSYGLYIYAFPCQQLVYWNGQNPYVNAALATILTVALAALSWVVIERPALELKKPVTVWLKRNLTFGF